MEKISIAQSPGSTHFKLCFSSTTILRAHHWRTQPYPDTYAPLCRGPGWVNTNDGHCISDRHSYTRTASSNINIHGSDRELHKYIPLT